MEWTGWRVVGAGKPHGVVVCPWTQGCGPGAGPGSAVLSGSFPSGTEGRPAGAATPFRLGVGWEGFPEGGVGPRLNVTLLYHQIRQQMEEQVAQKSSELEQYLQRVRELEDMYLQLQEALEDERQARQDEETVRKLQARCQTSLCAEPLGAVSRGANTGGKGGLSAGGRDPGAGLLGCLLPVWGARGEPPWGRRLPALCLLQS